MGDLDGLGPYCLVAAVNAVVGGSNGAVHRLCDLAIRLAVALEFAGLCVNEGLVHGAELPTGHVQIPIVR